MANHLPDEIISEILSPALRVSDATFSAMTSSADSPFMTFSESTSAFLVVSKAWLRVATPLLYNVVVLRSKAQAQSLAATLKASPTLGRFIKKLRVEGGYAISMFKILQASINITDLFLSLEIARSDNTCGLIRGLPLVDPVRVILKTRDLGSSLGYQEDRKLAQTLEKCIPTWKKLRVLEMPHRRSYNMDVISKALSQAPNLGTLVLRGHEYQPYQIPEYMRIIAANPSLKRIRLERPLGSEPPAYVLENVQRLKDALRKDERLNALVDLGDESPVLSSPFVYPARLSADPVLEDAIWSRVSYYTFCSPGWECLSSLLVCKTFARLGLPHLYASPTLESTEALDSFALQLERQPALGRSVRCLSLNFSGDLGVFKSVIEHTPVLTELHRIESFRESCPPITWKVFTDLGKLRGTTLRSFNFPVSKTSSAADPGLFALFPEMREFVWDSKTVFKTGPKLGPKSIPADTFSLLASLTINTFEASFLDVLSHMELPALRTMAFPPNAVGGVGFFERHGAKLRELTVSVQQLADPELSIWRTCPLMTVLGVACDEKHSAGPSDFKTADTHAHVERIVFRTPQYFHRKFMHSNDLYQLCATPQWAKPFPQLREIEHPRCEWPTTEREISKSEWVRLAELLREESESIHLVGPERVHWVPRLKFVKKSKGKK
ncbi:hypothetical protein DFH06DRAFT_1115663 [Mycena polygramma]|nr:hypothetical protein DFH06DRAFT_1070512 [Mycena polygramma]KAJ7602504.1 hypothetical protein DFH06DRAFT_1115663 [Mycena polygramma]